MPNSITKTGFVFKDQDDIVYLGLFENGGVNDFSEISDFDGIYIDLLLTKVVVVEVSFDTGGRFWINDLCSFEVGKETDDGFIPTEFNTMLKDLDFPSEDMNEVFRTFAKDAGSKTNVN